MTQNKRVLSAIVAVLVAITILHAGYRVFRGERASVSPPGSRGERLETWNDMRRLELTDGNISSFVRSMLSNRTLPVPKGTSAVSFDDLTDFQSTDIQEALEGFFTAYRENDPHPVYDYLAISRGPTQLAPELKRNIQDFARSEQALTLVTDAEAFVHLWNDLGSNGSGWEFLLDKSGESCFWETNTPLTPDQSIQMVLTDPALFGNTTSKGHVFEITLKLHESLALGNKVRFCDVFFVAELNEAKDRDFCATGVRFWFCEDIKKWVPHTLLLVTPAIRQDLQFLF